jgi:hypothetical protein
MRNARVGRLVGGLVSSLIALSSSAFPQNNVVTFDNKSGEPALVKLLGPTATSVEVPNMETRSVSALAGQYHIKIRYGSPPAYRFARGEGFVITESALSRSLITMTLHKVAAGNYESYPILEEEFGRSPASTEILKDARPATKQVETYVKDALASVNGSDKSKAFWYLTNALLFGHQRRKIKEAMDTSPLANAPPGIQLLKDGKIDPEAERESEYWSTYTGAIDTRIEELFKMVEVSPASDDVEVKMLRDRDLVGDAKCQPAKIGDVQMLCFLRQNRLDLATVEQRYGKPTKVFTSTSGAKYSFWGRILVFQPTGKNLPCVFRFVKW